MRRLVRMTTAGSIALATLMVSPGARAGDLVGPRSYDLWYEFAEPYLERLEGVTASAGDAKDVNAVTHMIDPWPRNVRNRRIPANGQRMAGAIDRYRNGRLQFAPPPITPIYNTTGVQSLAPPTSGAGGGGGGATTTTGP
jgi:hypothetical protein